MGVSKLRGDRAERNLGITLVPLSTAIPWVGNAQPHQSPTSVSYIVAYMGYPNDLYMCMQLRRLGKHERYINPL